MALPGRELQTQHWHNQIQIGLWNKRQKLNRELGSFACVSGNKASHKIQGNAATKMTFHLSNHPRVTQYETSKHDIKQLDRSRMRKHTANIKKLLKITAIHLLPLEYIFQFSNKTLSSPEIQSNTITDPLTVSQDNPWFYYFARWYDEESNIQPSPKQSFFFSRTYQPMYRGSAVTLPQSLRFLVSVIIIYNK